MPEIALEAIAERIPSVLAGPNSSVPVKTGLMKDSYTAEVQGDNINVLNDATNPYTGEVYAPDVEQGIPAPRTAGKTRETLENNIGTLVEAAQSAITKVTG